MTTHSAEFFLQMKGKEIFSLAEAPTAPDEEARTLRTGGISFKKELNDSSVPPFDAPIVKQTITLGGSPTTLDLTAVAALVIPALATRTVDLTGKKLLAVALLAASTNTGEVTIAPGASNPYPLFGTGNERDLAPGEIHMQTLTALANPKPAVSGTAKTITISGSSGNKLDLELYFGS
jgi:hypothetical protein